MAARLKARPTSYNGIRMRSRLEAGYAAWLDSWSFDWTYEPQAYASTRGQYLPDFLLRDVECYGLGGRRNVYVEVKPNSDTRGCPGEMGDRMAIIEESDPLALLVLQIPGCEPHYTAQCPGRGGRDWLPLRWVMAVPEPGRPGLGLAAPLIPHWGPWPDGYWEGPKTGGDDF